MAIIKSGVSFPSYAAEAVWTAGMPVNPDFPATNLSDLTRIRAPSVGGAPGYQSFVFKLPQVRMIDFIALVHHNVALGNCRVRLSAGQEPLTDTIFDSGIIGISNDSIFPRVQPISLGAVMGVRSGFVEMDTGAGGPLELGGVEIGRFWSWTDVNVPREIGIESTASVFSTAGGADHVTQQWSPRTIKGTRDVIDRSEGDTTLLDFQRANGLWRPFVWCWDLNDPATWAREAVLVTNADLPAGVAGENQSGSMAFAFKEHLL